MIKRYVYKSNHPTLNIVAKRRQQQQQQHVAIRSCDRKKRMLAYERWQKKDKRQKRMLENVITLRICQLWEITRKHIHIYIRLYIHMESGKTSGSNACLLLIVQLPWEGLNIYTKYCRLEGSLSLFHIPDSFFVVVGGDSPLCVHRLLQFLVFVNFCVRV